MLLKFTMINLWLFLVVSSCKQFLKYTLHPEFVYFLQTTRTYQKISKWMHRRLLLDVGGVELMWL